MSEKIKAGPTRPNTAAAHRKHFLAVTIRRKGYKGLNKGEVAGFPPEIAGKLVAAGIAQWYSAEVRDRAKGLGIREVVASPSQMEIMAAAEQLVRDKINELEAMTESSLAEKDARIAELEAAVDSGSKRKK